MLGVLAGGTGSAKLLQGLKSIGIADFFVIANVADNFWLHGLYICPDVDTAVYALSGKLAEERRWGIEGDTFNFFDQMNLFASENWFRLGDRDLATHVYRTRQLKQGRTLTDVTLDMGQKLGSHFEVFPSSDSHFETHIMTSRGEIHLQEFWVRERGEPVVLGIKYHGLAEASANAKLVEKLEDCEALLACPGNPVSSISPIISVPDISRILKNSKIPKIAVSPFIGEGPFSGPAGKMISALGLPANVLGMGKLYKPYFDTLLVDKADSETYGSVLKSEGFRVVEAKIILDTKNDEEELARTVVEIARARA